jgi:hypothetical protein
MATGPRRDFTLADAMILVAATAVGFALIRSGGMDLSPTSTKGALKYVNLVLAATWASFPFLMTWTPAILILSLIPPRPGLRRLFRQPGVAACGSATLVIAIELIPFLLFATTIGVESAMRRGFLVRMNLLVLTYGRNVPFAIEGAWATLVLSGFWRRRRTWIDRLGIILGVVWVAGQVVERCCLVFGALFL